MGFRANTRRIANQYSLKGWVRNLRDGSVEAVIEGDELMVDRFIQWCHRGPTSAYVSSVVVDKQPYLGEFTGFSVKNTL